MSEKRNENKLYPEKASQLILEIAAYLRMTALKDEMFQNIYKQKRNKVANIQFPSTPNIQKIKVEYMFD